MEPNPGDEASRDPGAHQLIHQGYTEKDYEGHRAHTMYVGVHLPGQGHHRRSHHRRHHRHHHQRKEEDDEERPVTPPAQRVQFILGEDADDPGAHESHPLFSEMEELVKEGTEYEWRETARWIKFEEDVEEGGNRWSKPHVATLSLHSLFELRSMLLNNTVMLDMEAQSLEQIADLILDNMVNASILPYDSKDKIREVLLHRHRHLHEKRKDHSSSHNMSRLPIIRSLAEIGRSHSSSKSAPNIDGMEHSASAASMTRNQSGMNLSENGDGSHSKMNTHFMRKIPPGAEASNILVGEVDFLDKPLAAFIRLAQATHLGDLTEVPVPTRFIFILLGPMGGISRYHEIGRAIATLMSDEVFHDVAYKAKHRQHLLAGIDEFLDAVTVLPPGEWDPSIRIEPPAAIPSQDPRKHPDQPKEDLPIEDDEEKVREESGLTRSGRLFGGLINDIKRKKPWYWSDFKDALALQCVASWIFLYFACLTPIITFGGLLGEATKQRMAAIESLVAGFVCGVGYSLFSGQPLTILGSTGPVLVFETIVFDFCLYIEWDYLSFRFWIGIWIAIILFILVALDASAFVCYITRFTEENFATLIAFIFIYKALEKLALIGEKNPINVQSDVEYFSECSCIPPDDYYNNTWEQQPVNWSMITRKECGKEYNGTLMGVGCEYHDNVYLMSIMLFMGTFIISIILKDFKNTAFLPSKVRTYISDFAVIIAILSMTTLDICVGIHTPKLQVPSTLTPTAPELRGWVIHPFSGNPYLSAIAAIIPALLGTILIFMDQQITSVIVNRKENKLKKGCGYHLDLFVLSILVFICSVMGLPWFVAATVLSINHVNSLKMESECAAPGEKPQFLGVREQRVTHMFIFITIGLSVLLTPALRLIPMPVLFGVFLYMGVASLKGLQFFDRILIMFMPAKYQPDFMFLRQVPLRRVHLYTCIQLACLSMLWIIKSFKATSILFPIMLVVMIGVRKLLDLLFTQRELKILDDIMPETTRRCKEDDSDLGDSHEHEDPTGDSSGNLQISLANGNIMKIPLASINISEEMNKSGCWQQVNNVNSNNSCMKDGKNNKENDTKDKTHKRCTPKDALSEEEKRRLSTMAEEEEDEGGITIKVD